MAHGWAGVKEMNLDLFATAFARAGIASLVFDHRGFGASEGLRGDIDPEEQIADYGTALDRLEAEEGVDAGRLGVWGTSYSGGHVLCVAARDARVRAAVAQVPTISGGETARRRRDPAARADLAAGFAAERESLRRGAPPTYVPAADAPGAPDLPGEELVSVDPSALPPAPTGVYSDADRGRFYADLPEERRRTWRNRVTLRSLERYESYEPGRLISASSAPLLVITAQDDTVTPTDLTAAAVAGASRDVETLSVPGGHYAVYTSERDRCAHTAAEFLAARLRG
jgi:uncharacterized protein